MNSNKYQMVIYWSNEDSAYLVEVPELPGCMADGKTRQEALSNAETIIQEWVETASDLGRPVPAPQGRLFTITETAERLGLSIAMVRRYCADGKLPAQKIGRDWAVLQRDIEQFAATPRHIGRPSLHYTPSLRGTHQVADKDGLVDKH
jgi:excisionase family DNA binding protein